MIFLCYVMIGFLAMVFAVTLFNALTAPMLKHGPKPASHPFVSVLIPARIQVWAGCRMGQYGCVQSCGASISGNWLLAGYLGETPHFTN